MKKLIKFLYGLPVVGTLAIETFKIGIDTPTFWIGKYLKNERFNLIQIGSNDGVSGDPIFNLVNRNKNWQVIFVEPVPYLFEKLKNNYQKEPRFIFENVAINDGTNQTFYLVSEEAKIQIPDLPLWYDQVGSFNRDNILNHFGGVLGPYIEELELVGLTLDQLIKRNNVESIDLLHVDVEGFDWIVLRQLNLDKFKPLIILYEHKHLNESDKIDSIKLLREDYRIFEFGGDFLCILKGRVQKGDLEMLKDRLIKM